MIQQPFRRRRDELPAVDVVSQGVVRRTKDAGVVDQTRIGAPGPLGRGSDRELPGEGLGALFETLDAQQFVAERFLRGRCVAPPEEL